VSSASLVTSRWSADDSDREDATPSAPSTERTTPEPTKCLRTTLQTDLETLTAYLAGVEPPARVAHALERVRDAVGKLLDRPEPTNAENTVQQLHEAVRKLAHQVERIQAPKPTYASVAGQGAQGHIHRATTIVEKPVPARHRREITVTKGKETPSQTLRTNKEIIEQLNASGVEGEVVAARRLQSGDMVLTTDDEHTRNRWLADSKWLAVLGEGARIKRREFARAKTNRSLN
jgi:hypothetical protein